MIRKTILCSFLITNLACICLANPIAPAWPPDKGHQVLRLPNTIYSSQDVNSFLTKLANCQSSVSAFQLHLQDIGCSENGLPLLMVTVAESSISDSAAGGVLVVARQHGDEPAGTQAAVELIHRIYLGQEPDLLHNLCGLPLRIVPIANPDGMDNFHRRTANGKDMNRDWNIQSLCETQAIMSIINRYQPDVVMDLHELAPSDRSKKYIAALPAPKVEGLIKSVRKSVESGQHLSVRIAGRRSSTRLLYRHFASRCGRPGILVESKRSRNALTNLDARAQYHLAAIRGIVKGLSDECAGRAVVTKDKPNKANDLPSQQKPGW